MLRFNRGLNQSIVLMHQLQITVLELPSHQKVIVSIKERQPDVLNIISTNCGGSIIRRVRNVQGELEELILVLNKGQEVTLARDVILTLIRGNSKRTNAYLGIEAPKEIEISRLEAGPLHGKIRRQR